MRWYYMLRLRLRSLFLRKDVEQELHEELEHHISLQTERHIAQGRDPGEARYAALRRMDGLEQRIEECRDHRGMSLWDSLVQDLRYALRGFRKQPGFTAVAIASLALGIGCNTAVFSFLNTLVLAKLPVKDPDHLYQLTVARRNGVRNRFSYPEYQQLAENRQLFVGVAVWGMSKAAYDQGDRQYVATVNLVSDNYFEVLGITPAAGRLLQPGDDQQFEAVVLSYPFWQRIFQGSPGAIGSRMRFGSGIFTIVGVTPQGFGGAEMDVPPDATFPVHAMRRMEPDNANVLENKGAAWIKTLLRLPPGITPIALRPLLRDWWPSVQLPGRSAPPGGWPQVLDIQEGGRGVSATREEFSRAVIVLMVLVLLVLLIVCANLASLLLARALTRRKEMAVRLALGAGARRLIRQMLTESLLLAITGGVVGIFAARWITLALLFFVPQAETGFLDFHIDQRIAAFALVVTCAAVILFGLIPAWQASRVPLIAAMNQAARGAGGSRRSWLGRSVIAAQVAICLVLVAGGVMFARSLLNVLSIDLGMQADDLFLVQANPINVGLRGERAEAFVRQVIETVKAMPSVAGAVGLNSIPLDGSAWWNTPTVPGYSGEPSVVYMNAVTPDYFATMGTRVLQGREFTGRDSGGSLPVAIVNQQFIRKYYPEEQAIGKHFRLSDDAGPDDLDLEIVGVVEDTKYVDPRESPKELVYFSLLQSRKPVYVSYMVRLKNGTDRAMEIKQIRKAIEAIAPGIGVGIQPFIELFDRAVKRDRMIAMLSAAFGLLGIVLASIGLYGTVAQTVASRTGELGIRATLGATWWQMEWTVLRDALILVLAGVVVGTPIAILSGRLAQGLLFGLKPGDALTTISAVTLLVAVTVLAAWIPARRASRVDPMTAVRHE